MDISQIGRETKSTLAVKMHDIVCLETSLPMQKNHDALALDWCAKRNGGLLRILRLLNHRSFDFTKFFLNELFYFKI